MRITQVSPARIAYEQRLLAVVCEVDLAVGYLCGEFNKVTCNEVLQKVRGTVNVTVGGGRPSGRTLRVRGGRGV